MPELEIRLTAAERFNDCAMSDATQCKHDRVFRKLSQFICEEGIAGVHFGTNRLVVRRQALDGIRNPALRQYQFVIDGKRLLVRRKAEFVQALVQKYPGMISGKRPAGSIGPMHARRKTDNQKPRRRVPEWRHWPAMVIWISFLDRVQETGQARAGPAVFVEAVIRHMDDA